MGWDTEHILAACVLSSGIAGEVLREAGLTIEAVRAAIEEEAE